MRLRLQIKIILMKRVTYYELTDGTLVKGKVWAEIKQKKLNERSFEVISLKPYYCP